jgi:hypothetical protein
MIMEAKYCIKSFTPAPHSYAMFLCKHSDGAYLSNAATFPRDVVFFDTEEEALEYAEKKLAQNYIELVKVYKAKF